MDATGVDLSELEEAFVAAADYYARRGITYTAWRAAGVAPAVLRRPGITRSQSYSCACRRRSSRRSRATLVRPREGLPRDADARG